MSLCTTEPWLGTTRGVLSQLRNDDKVRAWISEAEVITIYTGDNDVWDMLYGLREGSRTCGSASDPDMDCIRAGEAAIEENIDAILSEILALRSADEALTLIADGCNIYVPWWQEAGIFEELKGPGYEDWSKAIDRLAEKYGVVAVHTYIACNGPEGDEPIPANLLVPSEWFHFNEAGHRMAADLHRAAGYEHGQ